MEWQSMTQYSTEPEYIVQESERILPMANKLVYTNLTSNMEEVQVELRLLSQEAGMCITTLENIRASLHVLSQSLEAQS